MSALVWGHRRHRTMRSLLWRSGWGPIPLVGLIVAGSIILAMTATVIVTAFAILLSLAIVAGVFAVLRVGVFHLARLMFPSLTGLAGATGAKRWGLGSRSLRAGVWQGTIRRAGTQARSAETVLSPVDVLRRRYAAGEIGQTEFRRRLLDLVKERYVRGDLTLAEYEIRVRHLMQDPALRPPV